MTDPNTKCEYRIDAHLASRLAELEQIFRAYQRGNDEGIVEGDVSCDEFNNYGLSFDYVVPSTWQGQNEGYWRYQVSYGGPSDEWRFYASSAGDPVYRVEYWFMDWFDGARRVIELDSPQGDLMQEVWACLLDSDTPGEVEREARARV